jgi:hypothetical protein
MSFIVRTIFWLGLAMVMLPPEARLGSGDDAAEFRNIDLALEAHNMAYGLWSASTKITSVCETNPQLCKAGSDLVNASLAAATNVATDITDRLRSETAKPLATAENDTKTSKKFQARVE